jgi:transposase-like protein
VGIWAQPTKQEALTQLTAFKGKYGKLSPEAVRSLAEEEDKTLTFYDFPQTLHRYIRTTNAIESLWSLVRQRTEQIDVFTRRVELPDHRLGNDRRHSTANSPALYHGLSWFSALLQ